MFILSCVMFILSGVISIEFELGSSLCILPMF
jgi:hypothetical protein